MSHPWLSGAVGSMDDAALLQPEGSKSAFVYTMDVITPIVDDPRSFGRIAAANSLSDVYAMGGKPQVALSFVGMPGAVGLEVLSEVIQGMAEKSIEAGCAVVGGHTIKDSEPKCGLAVIGSVDHGKAWTHTHARAGQSIVLTKPIGTGVLAQALRATGDVGDSVLAAAVVNMETLNKDACEVGLALNATSATDVTGFGLLGHLFHMAEASGLCVELQPSSVPLLEGAYKAASEGHIPGGSKRNLLYVQEYLQKREQVDPVLLQLLADAQTSGGLMLSLDSDQAQLALERLPGSAIIGSFFSGKPGTISFS